VKGVFIVYFDRDTALICTAKKNATNRPAGSEWRGIDHGAFEAGLDKINRMNRILGIG
jgi:hypothetical protein